MALLSLSKVESYIENFKVLKGVSFSVQQGETVGIIGPNGSGKTTLFNAVSGFVPISSGKITFKGNNISSLSPYKRAKLGIGRVFQNFGIFKQMTVLDNMLIAIEARQRGLHKVFPWLSQNKKNKELALNYLAKVGLEDRAKETAASLSGGQLRLLELIRTLAFGAELFLLDEPTAGVSPKMKKDIAELITDICNQGRTIIIIEHDLAFIEEFCERVIVLNVGQVVLDDTPQVVRSHPLLKEIYFGKENQIKGEERNEQ
ncbi:MAG: ABC transporter ATP-binding protein [Candidatus Dadabacteria bacterium]|nr:MAG: ABC transporter ATP-binding protein [Candidatus Dadabacteria bacterium]